VDARDTSASRIQPAHRNPRRGHCGRGVSGGLAIDHRGLLLRAGSLPNDGDRWEYQLKFDGYRTIAFKTCGRLHLRSRNDNDFSIRYSDGLKGLAKLPDETVINGELIALDDNGRPSFNILQNYGSSKAPVLYFVFDVMVVAGRDVRQESLEGTPASAPAEKQRLPQRKGHRRLACEGDDGDSSEVQDADQHKKSRQSYPERFDGYRIDWTPRQSVTKCREWAQHSHAQPIGGHHIRQRVRQRAERGVSPKPNRFFAGPVEKCPARSARNP
jgi:hypothetical protein